MKNRLKVFLLGLFFIANTVSLNGDTISYGGENKWENVVTENIKNIYIPYKGYGLTVDYQKQPVKNELNLYLSFNDVILTDLTGNYDIEYYNFKPSHHIFVNGKSGGFFRPKQYVVVKIDANSFLNNHIDLDSFVFDFYIYPVLINEKTVLIKKGVFYDDKFFGIKVGFNHRKIEVHFENFFYDSQNKAYTIILKSVKNISLKKWRHIEIFFNKSTGVAGLIINGEKEDIKYATITGGPDNEVLVPRFSKFDGSSLVLFKNFYGYIDEFKIANKSRISYTETSSGTVESKEIDLKYYNSIVKRLQFKFDKENTGYMKLFLKKGNTKFDLKKEWTVINAPIKGGNLIVKNINNIRYLKWKVELRRGDNESPVLRSVDIEYEQNLKPLVPKKIKVKIFNENILLKWDIEKNVSVKGYIIYWGTKSGNYENKLDVGMKKEYILTGLKKGVRYYFTVTSYNSKEPYNESVYSKEVSIYYK